MRYVRANAKERDCCAMYVLLTTDMFSFSESDFFAFFTFFFWPEVVPSDVTDDFFLMAVFSDTFRDSEAVMLAFASDVRVSGASLWFSIRSTDF